jgi:hypothetical protein
MDSKSDTLLLSFKENPELQAALGDLQPGDQVELCVKVTCRANDKDSFDSTIDEVELMDSMEPSDGPDEDDEEDEDELTDVIVRRKKKEAASA